MMQPALFAGTGQHTEPAPKWLLRHLDENGYIDITTGAARKARPAKCKCGKWVIRALNNDMCAWAVDCDPEPLTPEGEALARIAGIAVYELNTWAGRPQLDHRWRWSIAAHPAGSRDTDVVAQHDCDRTLALPNGPSRLPVPSGSAELPEDPPF